MNNRLFSPKAGKGILLGLVASLLFCTGNASAQDYIGGSFSFAGASNHASSSGANQTTTTTTISIAPDFGWYFGDKWAFGLRPWVAFSYSGNSGTNVKALSLEINPYARYLLFDYNRFGLWAEASPEIGFQKSWHLANSVGWESDSYLVRYEIRLLPVLTYQLTDHISLESRLNLFSLAMAGSHTTGNDGVSFNSLTYGLSASTKDVTGTLSDISIGFLYKF